MFKQRVALRGLRQEIDRTREIDRLQIGLILDHNGSTLDLSGQTYHLGVAVLAKYNHLTTNLLHFIVGALDFALQCRHHGARRVDHLDRQLLGTSVGRRGLAVSTNKQSTTAEMFHIVVRNGLQTKLFEALYLNAIMHNVA